MPLCTIQLLSLKTNISDFTQTLQQRSSLKPLVIARVLRWIVKPTILSINPLLNDEKLNPPAWDILLIYEESSKDNSSWPGNDPLNDMIRTSWQIKCGIPNHIIQSFKSSNTKLLQRSSSGKSPPLTTTGSEQLPRPKAGSNHQSLELDEDLYRWIKSADAPGGAVSMLNLLAFHPGMEKKYLKYGEAFARDVGARRGGVAKLVGKVVEDGSVGSDGWDEVRYLVIAFLLFCLLCCRISSLSLFSVVNGDY